MTTVFISARRSSCVIASHDLIAASGADALGAALGPALGVVAAALSLADGAALGMDGVDSEEAGAAGGCGDGFEVPHAAASASDEKTRTRGRDMRRMIKQRMVLDTRLKK